MRKAFYLMHTLLVNGIIHRKIRERSAKYRSRRQSKNRIFLLYTTLDTVYNFMFKNRGLEK